jgi:dethiobiotin synthetase
MSKAYFIAGTDTGVGKTLVATAMLRLAEQNGLSTLGLKPVSAGCDFVDEQWMNDDARELMLTSTISPAYSNVNPVALRTAMAPHIAAQQENIDIQPAELASHCRAQLGNADFCVIEGAGGWQVPLNDTATMADLAIGIGSPVVLVVGMRLGCINHALLTADAIRHTGLPLAGWVANHIDPTMIAADENVASLQSRLGAPLLGRIPALSNTDLASEYLELP